MSGSENCDISGILNSLLANGISWLHNSRGSRGGSTGLVRAPLFNSQTKTSLLTYSLLLLQLMLRTILYKAYHNTNRKGRLATILLHCRTRQQVKCLV